MDKRDGGDREAQRRDIDREVRRADGVRERFLRELDDFEVSMETLRRPVWQLPPDEHPGEAVPMSQGEGGPGA